MRRCGPLMYNAAMPTWRLSRRRFWSAVVLTLLIVFYVATWPLTRTAGVINVGDYPGSHGQLVAIAPLVIYEDRRTIITASPDPRQVNSRIREQRYYLWLFGYVVKLSDSRGVFPPAQGWR